METEKLRALLKAHDWYYEWSDSLRVYERGVAQRQEIFEALGQMPAKDAMPLIGEFCPPKLYVSFMSQMEKRAKARIAR